MIRPVAAAAFAALALSTGSASAATSARCDVGPQIGTACLRIPEVVRDACRALEHQPPFYFACND